ncbi:glycosyltransferase family 4 protein [Pseudomonadota bacterium]
MRIAVYVEGNPRQGGGFTHQLSVLKSIRNHAGAGHEFLIFCMDSATAEAAKSENLESVVIRQGPWLKLRRLISRQSWIYRISSKPALSKWVRSPLEPLFNHHNIDLVFFPCPSVAALELTTQNYIFTVWDLCHLEQPEFPEVRAGRDFEQREELYSRALKKAVSVITDSDYGKELVTRKYQIEPDRVMALPFIPSPFTLDFIPDPAQAEEVRRKYELEAPYIFYPAQFWPHKNHVYLLKALETLSRLHGLEVKAVFSGSDKGLQKFIMEKAAALGIEHQVNCIGFADDEDMPYLYQGALALTMPTWFGPTNIPPLDAFALGCPVCYSDLPAFGEQLGDAAFFMDLSQPESLADILRKLLEQPGIADEKIKRGKAHTEQWGELEYAANLTMLFNEFEQKLECWK